MLSDTFPLDPPSEWFTTVPDWFLPNMKFTVVTEGPEAGRVAATVAQRGTYILNQGAAWKSSDSPTGYRDAMQGDTPTSDGVVLRTAALSADLNHVGGSASYGQAVDAMAHTGAQLARVRYVDVPGFGTVALGAAWPGLTDLQVRKMQASALSGDWRWREEYRSYDMAGAIFVNNPGLPLPARPVFAPVAMAASLGSIPPPILGSWQPQEQIMPENNYVTCRCGQHLPAGTLHSCVATQTIDTHLTPVVAATAATPEGVEVQVDGGEMVEQELVERLSALEERVAQMEEWLAAEAMANADAMEASLPQPTA